MNNWSGTTAVVTGAGGFIGSHLVERLVTLGARVKALHLYDPLGSNGWLDALPPDVRTSVDCTVGDVRDTDCMRRLIEPEDVVFHLAALVGIPYSYQTPRSYLDTNVGGTLNVIEACRRGARRLLVVSTSEVYGSALRTPIPEDHPLQAQSPYAASKIAAEKLAESCYRSFDVPIVVARPFNTFGPRQSARAVIPTVLMQALAGEATIALGDAETTRDFNYVGDTVEGMVRLAACAGAVGRVVNIGTGRETSIARMVSLVAELTGRELTICRDSRRMRPEASEVRRLCADNRLLKSLTDWTPRHDLRDGLSRTAEWMRRSLHAYQTSRYYV